MPICSKFLAANKLCIENHINTAFLLGFSTKGEQQTQREVYEILPKIVLYKLKQLFNGDRVFAVLEQTL